MGNLTVILQVARDILFDAGQKGLHCKDIAEKAVLQNKNMGMTAEEFQKKVQVALAGHLKKKTGDIIFAPVNHVKGMRKGKPMQGWYRLKIKRNKPLLSSPEPELPQTTSFAGKAGEYAVMSELLFWGFNPSIMTVDDGIDVVATKDGQFYLLQVKTAQQNNTGKYCFSIKKSSYNKYNSKNVFYIFVLRSLGKNSFIIIPSHQIEYFINTGKISSNQERISFYICYHDKSKKIVINGQEDIQPYFGNFGVIK